MKVQEGIVGAQAVAFNGGPLDRQVHVWSKAEVAANEAVWVGDDRKTGYVRSRTWRTQQRNQRPVTYAWTKIGKADYLGMPSVTITPGAASNN